MIGAGRVGTALATRARDNGVACTLIDRTHGWESLDRGQGDPVLVAVRNDDLEEVVRRVPSRRRRDLVFLQNGMIRPFLRDHGLLQATRGLLWFAVAERGGPLRPGYPATLSGEHAGPVATWFRAIGLEAEVTDWLRFATRETEKLLWLSTMGILCELYDCDVGTVATTRRAELTMLTSELLVTVSGALGIDFPLEWVVGRMCAYSMLIPEYRASVKEWRWRNGWFDQRAVAWGMATPVHHELLRAIGKGELIALRD